MGAISNEFDLDSILNEFRDSPEQPAPTEAGGEQAPENRSNRLVLKSMDDAFRVDEIETPDAAVENIRLSEAEPEDPFAPPPETVSPPSAPSPEPELRELSDTEENVEYASAEAVSSVEPPAENGEGDKKSAGKSASERILAPIIGLLALIGMRQEQRVRGGAGGATLERGAAAKDPDPKEAAKLYGSQLASLRLRALAASLITLLMVYVSVAWSSFLPLGGALGSSERVCSMLLVVMELSVMLCGLDLLTGGLLSFSRRRIGTESLIAVSCVLTALDALVLAAVNRTTYGLPYCAVSALSMTAALWGAYCNCRTGRLSCRVLAAGKSPYAVLGDAALSPGEVTLMRARKQPEGFIARGEEEDFGESVYSALVPFLLIASVLLGLLSSLARGRAGSVLHCVASMAAVSATFSCALCVALPLYIAAKKLSPAGAAVAGWSGLRDVGTARSLVVSDTDVFPYGTVRIGNIRLVENADADKVIAYTGSVIAASGSTLAAPFAELMRRNGYTMCRVENFTPKDGGGMAAAVRGESVSVGSSGFMNLIGIRMPRKLTAPSAIYTAINGALVAIFEIEYEPVAQVQEALVMLNQSRLTPVFAARDFNITPAMIKNYFDLPTDRFHFPAYSERYEISAPEADRPGRRVAAVLGQDGMGALVDLAECARRACQAARISTALSAAASVLGLLLLFLLCWTGAFAAAGAGSAILFLLIFFIPELVLCILLWRM
ncbi:MAG: hypothetical protein IJ705_05355 [Oscillospiraceae bacterium]|nr:hypothetical protein [Oscillospiraceae bacterium]